MLRSRTYCNCYGRLLHYFTPLHLHFSFICVIFEWRSPPFFDFLYLMLLLSPFINPSFLWQTLSIDPSKTRPGPPFQVLHSSLLQKIYRAGPFNSTHCSYDVTPWKALIWISTRLVTSALVSVLTFCFLFFPQVRNVQCFQRSFYWNIYRLSDFL